MRNFLYLINAIALIAAIILAVNSPDLLSTAFIGVMMTLILLGELIGILPTISIMNGLRHGQDSIRRASDAQTDSIWEVVKENTDFFHHRKLNDIFHTYREKVRYQRSSGQIMSDIEDFLNEDVIDLMTWRSVVRLLPGTLTGLGILGTFVGLILGINGIGFEDVESAISSVQNLLSGIDVAFYTSIGGVILSIIFSVSQQVTQNMMLRELGIFTQDFHNYVIPSVAEQERYRDGRELKRVIQLLDRLPREESFSANSIHESGLPERDSERIMMPQIMDGMEKGEFIFYLQPRYHLMNRKMTGSEALVRWNHPTMGLVSPAVFIPVMEKNGYITQLDQMIWKSVCRQLKVWIDQGHTPVPVTLNVTKTDLMAMDVPGVFESLLKEYKISPRYIDIDLSESVYLQSHKMAAHVEQALIQLGFRVIVSGFQGDFVVSDAAGGWKSNTIQIDLRNYRKTHEFTFYEADRLARQAHDLNHTLIASGIESMQELSLLRKAGFDEGQGYYLSKPLPIDKFEEAAFQIPSGEK